MIRRRGNALASVMLALALVSTSCIARKVTVTGSAAPKGTGDATGSPAGGQAGPRPPCLRVRTKTSSTPPAREPLPPVIAKVADEVEQVRGLTFKRAVAAEAVSQKEIGKMLHEGLDEGFPEDEATRTSQAWAVMGVIPKGIDLRKAVEDFNSSQVIGFYDDEAERLVIIGSASPSPYQRFILAHELTHALQDQNFNLGRLDQLDRTCQDERVEAFLSLTEGDATETAVQWAQQNLTAEEITEFDREASDFTPPPSSVPPFVQNLLIWPYGPGRTFVQALLAEGGEQAVDDALKSPPASTEQILHPDKYPSDQPMTTNVPDFGPRLGSGWEDLDFEDIGEGWFQLMLQLRIPKASGDTAAAGWDGGQYRAWADPEGNTAVVMDTAWDTDRDATEFAQAMDNWLGDDVGTVLSPSGRRVRVLFASDQATLDRLNAAIPG